MDKKHILILGDVDSVKGYLDFFENQYSIITSEYEYNFMPSSIKFAANAIYKVATPSHFDAACFENSMDLIISYVSEIVEKYGKIDCVVSTHEHTVLPAGAIRTLFGIEGLQEDQAQALRDKNLMKTKISEYGLPVPQFSDLNRDSYENQIQEFINMYGEVVLKPADQAGSHGILITSDIERAKEHARKLFGETNNVSLEQYINLPLMHIDGVVIDGEMQFLSVSRYIGTCYEYVYHRKSIATMILNDQEVYEKARNFVTQCLKALDIESLVFHLEVFENERGDFMFLEIAGRYAGAGVVSSVKKVFDFDLIKASYHLDCHLPLEMSDLGRSFSTIYPMAMLLLPSPVAKSILIRGIAGLENLPHSVVGSEFAGAGTISEHSSIDAFKAIARFYISDQDPAVVERAIRQVESQVKFFYEEV